MGFVSVEQELDLIKGYVELEELRFSEQFDVQWDIHSDLDLDVKIPSMILQPFIENAILHGLTPLESRKGILKIELLELNDYVEVVISDNGNGFIKETKAQNELKLKKSRGMEIVKERLTLYSLKLKQEMSYDLTTSELGTTVIVKFPILSEKELIF
jgi:sensor histidine kinase YesM